MSSLQKMVHNALTKKEGSNLCNKDKREQDERMEEEICDQDSSSRDEKDDATVRQKLGLLQGLLDRNHETSKEIASGVQITFIDMSISQHYIEMEKKCQCLLDLVNLLH